MNRVRAHDPVIGTLVRDVSERSQTFRALVAALNATNGLVYISAGRCGRLRACLLHRVAIAGPHRVLNIVVDLERPDLDLTAAIAHELQHALEVLGDPRITSDLDIFAFYRLHGIEVKGVIETRAAIEAGDDVRRELESSGRGAAASRAPRANRSEIEVDTRRQGR